MTPHDEWDYDGVNEMILADQDIDGTNHRTLVHFDRNGFGYTLSRNPTFLKRELTRMRASEADQLFIEG